VPKPPNPTLRALGSRIRTFRAAKGLSQEELADQAGVDRSYMSGIERGIRNISVLKAVAIAEALDVTVARLFGRR
jgi:transcriptional regulator with XRE-family HTH domain